MKAIAMLYRRIAAFFNEHQGLGAIFWLLVAIICVAAIEPTYLFFKGLFVTTADDCILARLNEMQTDTAVRALLTICQRTFQP